jgi:DNA-binding SARP family transcriptional activator
MGGGLFLRVLGPLRLERDGQDVDIGGARQREVLARLAVAGPPLSRPRDGIHS